MLFFASVVILFITTCHDSRRDVPAGGAIDLSAHCRQPTLILQEIARLH